MPLARMRSPVETRNGFSLMVGQGRPTGDDPSDGFVPDERRWRSLSRTLEMR